MVANLNGITCCIYKQIAMAMVSELPKKEHICEVSVVVEYGIFAWYLDTFYSIYAKHGHPT